MSVVLEVNELTKIFGKRAAVDKASFQVNSGEVFGFLGPNGAGKTTAIKVIMGFLAPDEGQIIINGTDVKKDYEKAMENIGGIVENPEMYKELSGRKNLEMYARIHDNVPAGRIDEVLRLVGMENRAEEKIKKYSLGMKQRICLAQALLHKPNLLILDEPTNGLDPAGIKELRDILKHLAHEEGVAVMVSSHMLAEMELMCDRVGIINNGRILGIMPIEELLHKTSGNMCYRIKTNDSAACSEILKASYGETAVRFIDGSNIELSVNESEVPAVVRLLTENGIDIFIISPAGNSLEDAFINITGGGNPIA
ncbi:MAG: ABC transporter ATP-binding protein [Clostridiales bacterium]|nr:ABC transporter ATP-binding protein [Clostridiales bacterium]